MSLVLPHIDFIDLVTRCSHFYHPHIFLILLAHLQTRRNTSLVGEPVQIHPSSSLFHSYRRALSSWSTDVNLGNPPQRDKKVLISRNFDFFANIIYFQALKSMHTVQLPKKQVPPYVVYAELLVTSKSYLRGITVIDGSSFLYTSITHHINVFDLSTSCYHGFSSFSPFCFQRILVTRSCSTILQNNIQQTCR